MSERRILALGLEHGFTPSPRPGFVGMERQDDDGRTVRLDVFTWSNRAHAARARIPRAYLVICLTSRGGEGRWRLPLVVWPSTDQPMRPWADVRAEFAEVFGPALRGEVAWGAVGTDRHTLT